MIPIILPWSHAGVSCVSVNRPGCPAIPMHQVPSGYLTGAAGSEAVSDSECARIIRCLVSLRRGLLEERRWLGLCPDGMFAPTLSYPSASIDLDEGLPPLQSSPTQPNRPSSPDSPTTCLLAPDDGRAFACKGHRALRVGRGRGTWRFPAGRSWIVAAETARGSQRQVGKKRQAFY